MVAPAWIDGLREREDGGGQVFLLHGGAVADGRWRLGEEQVDCLTALMRYFTGTGRRVIVFDPDMGLLDPESAAPPGDGLDAAWEVLTRQPTALVILQAERLSGGSGRSPPLASWPGHPALRATGASVVLLAEDLPRVTPDLREAAGIHALDLDASPP